jgi:arylsulfatase A-like enzyme
VLIHPRHEKLAWDHWATAIRYYYAFTTLIDRQIGRMLDYLEASGQAENTVVVFSADHGQTLGSHGGLTDKGWLHFEEIHRIPMIIRIPGTGPRQIKELVSSVDLYPTLLDLAGAAWDPSAVHGRSVLPLISGKTADWRDMVVSEFNGLNSMVSTLRTVRCGDIKYGFSCTNQDELYDLARDPHETRNLIDHPAYAGTAAEMRSRLLDWTREMKDPMSWWLHRMYGFYGSSH